MEPSKEAIAVRVTRLNRQILGKVTSGATKITKRTIDREALFDALTALYDECNDDPVKRTDDLVRVFVDKYRSTLAELRRARVCFSDFEVIQTIGRGYFGEVHMVREKQTSDVYALKTVKKELARKRVTGAEDERDILATSTSQWLPRLQYAFQDASNLYLVMELCSGGDLAGLLARRSEPLSARDAAFYVCEVAHALKALHHMGYVHRDVKPHNILLDRCGHIKLADFGSCSRLSEGAPGGEGLGATADYAAPEVLAAAHCQAAHAVCSEYCRARVTHAISACDYWSLGVVAFELVTLQRPFSSDDDDSMVQILANIQKYERSAEPVPPFPAGVCAAWRALVSGLLRVAPGARYSYLDTLQHPALAHLPVHAIRDQPPPWVPLVRGAEDASFLCAGERVPPAPNAAPFRTRLPYNGQLPFVGYSYIASEEAEDSASGFSASLDCTAIDLATYKSAEKLATMRGREIASLQNRLAAAEASAGAAAERARRDADGDAERTRAKLNADITALTLQNKRLERQIEVEREERMALQRTNQELSMGAAERSSSDTRAARADADRLAAERDTLRGDMTRMEQRVAELQDELARACADAARSHHQYKDIIVEAQELRHRRFTEINVRAIDSIAKERAIRRQTLSGGEAESRELASRLANAEASLARETRARDLADKRLASLDRDYEKVLEQNKMLQAELDDLNRQLSFNEATLKERQVSIETATEELAVLQKQLAQEKLRNTALTAQVHELESGIEAAATREAALEEQATRTEARLRDKLAAVESDAAEAAGREARHCEKVTTLEQLVRQLEREVGLLEARACPKCTAAESASTEGYTTPDTSMSRPGHGRDAHSDTESVCDVNVEAGAQVALLKEQLERAEGQLQARAEEMATLKQEARAANLARWRKEREYNELSVEAKSSAREAKRLEERLTTAQEARKKAEQAASELKTEMAALKPQHETAVRDVERLREELNRLKKTHETAQAEVDRSRNDIRKLKSELQYSEKRRLHAEQQEELSARERAALRDDAYSLRGQNEHLTQNNKALQEACHVLEEQLTDLEKLTDIHELKNNELESECTRLRSELSSCRDKLESAQSQATRAAADAAHVRELYANAEERADRAQAQITILTEKLEAREARVTELEAALAAAECASASSAAAVSGGTRRLRALQEECAAAHTRAHSYHAQALQAQAALADAQEEVSAAREAAAAHTAWWRAREAKSDATLRQQAKLIDFLQAKLEDAARGKCSLADKLFRRRARASPPLRRTNRELRDEVDRLRAKLAASNSSFEINSLPPTPRREKPRTTNNISVKSIDTPDGADDDHVLVVWPDDSRERMHISCVEGAITLTSGDTVLKARCHSGDVIGLPQHEANRAFAIKVENSIRGSTAAVVCASLAGRARWAALAAARPPPAPAPAYAALRLTELGARPAAALHVAHDAVAIGCTDGLHSLRGVIRLERDGPHAMTSRATAVTSLSAACGRVLAVCDDSLVHGSVLSLGSLARRAGSLQPSLEVAGVALPEHAPPPHLVKSSTSDSPGGCVAVACGRRVFVLRFEAGAGQFKLARSLTVDRPPPSLLLTPATLYIAGERPLKVNLPSGVIEPFATDEPTISAAIKKHSPPRAILLIKQKPLEILLCYTECGVFVDEKGKRTRTEDPKWSSKVHGWEFVHPFLYVVGEEKITIIYINEETYRSPPCTCGDATSLHSSASECYQPEIYQLRVKEPALLGTAPDGIIISTRDDDSYNISKVDGMAAFRSIGASVESLETVSRGSSTDLAQSITDLREINTNGHEINTNGHETSRVSQDSVEATTGFLADIRQRAKQLRAKNRQENSEDMIKHILTTEVDLKRLSSTGRKSPDTSEIDSDSTESEDRTESTKGTSDLCAEMFTRQVRFQ